LCWAFFKDCSIGSYNRMPTMRFVLRKTPEFDFSEEHSIQVYDYNPAHAIWYILHTLTGLPESWLHEADFAAVAATLADEQRGISIVFDRQQSALNYLETINAHVGNVTRYGADGKFHPKLIREDYDVETLLSVDETVMVDEPSFTRKSWIDTINEVKVQYTEIVTECICGETTIGYTTLSMDVDESQVLEVVNPAPSCVYEWEITEGGGTLTPQDEDDPQNLSMLYTAPGSNPNCDENPTITLSVGGNQCDSISIAINAYEFESTTAYAIATPVGYTTCARTWDWFCCNCCGPTGPCTSHDDCYKGTLCDTLVCTYRTYNCWDVELDPECDKSCAYAGTASRCQCVEGFNHDGITDQRSSAMIEGGCCPAALM